MEATGGTALSREEVRAREVLLVPRVLLCVAEGRGRRRLRQGRAQVLAGLLLVRLACCYWRKTENSLQLMLLAVGAAEGALCTTAACGCCVLELLLFAEEKEEDAVVAACKCCC